MFVKITVDFGGVNFPAPYKDPDKLYIGFVSVFSGCRRALRGNPCPDCQNPSLWAGVPIQKTLNWGDEYIPASDVVLIESFVRKKYENFKNITAPVEFFYCVLGGEPLDQHPMALEIVHNQVVRGCNHQLPTVLFTGYPSYQDPAIDPMVLDYVKERVDYIKVGPYLGNQYKEDNLETGLATRNQQWIKIK